MRKVVLLGLAVVVGVLAVSAVAFADRGHGKGDSKSFSARLNGWEEDPSQVTTGKGSFRAKVVSATRIDFKLTYQDLEGPAFMAHIHIGSRHESGGISAWLCGGTTQPASCSRPDGTVEGASRRLTSPDRPARSRAGRFVDLLRAMRKGETYTNVHTGSAGPPQRACAHGEIRGIGRSTTAATTN